MRTRQIRPPALCLSVFLTTASTTPPINNEATGIIINYLILLILLLNYQDRQQLQLWVEVKNMHNLKKCNKPTSHDFLF